MLQTTTRATAHTFTVQYCTSTELQNLTEGFTDIQYRLYRFVCENTSFLYLKTVLLFPLVTAWYNEDIGKRVILVLKIKFQQIR